MHGFGGPDADQNPQGLHACCSLCHRRIKAGATLFDCGEVEPGCICDRLQEIWIACVGIGSGNGCVLMNCESWDGLRENKVWFEVGGVIPAPVPGPPAG